MKITAQSGAILALTLLVPSLLAAPDSDSIWYVEAANAQQVFHQDAGGRLRADGILRDALSAARNGLAAPDSSGGIAEVAPSRGHPGAAAPPPPLFGPAAP